MNIKELSEYLNLKPKTIYNLIAANKIPYRRISPKKVIFSQDEIDAWMKERGFDMNSQAAGMRTEVASVPKESLKTPLERLITPAENLNTLPGSPGASLGSPQIPSGSLTAPDQNPIAATAAPIGGPIRNMVENPLRRFIRHPALGISLVTFLIFAWLGSFLYLNHKISANSSKALTASLLEKDVLLAKAKGPDSGFIINSARNEISSVAVPSSKILPLLIGIISRGGEDYASKSHALDIIKAYVNEKGVYRTLIDIMKNDPNELIRMKAASALIKMVELDEVKKALLERLKSESNATIRFKILEAFEQSNDRELLRKINELMSQENDPDVISKKKQILNNLKKVI